MSTGHIFQSGVHNLAQEYCRILDRNARRQTPDGQVWWGCSVLGLPRLNGRCHWLVVLCVSYLRPPNLVAFLVTSPPCSCSCSWSSWLIAVINTGTATTTAQRQHHHRQYQHKQPPQFEVYITPRKKQECLSVHNPVRTWPVGTDPVKDNLSTPGCLESAAPAGEPSPVRTFRAPAGSPAAAARPAMRTQVSGASSEGFLRSIACQVSGIGRPVAVSRA